MRIKRVAQASIYEIFTLHELAQELKVISAWLDTHAQILDWVEADLCRDGIMDTGRLGMSVESVLRCALLKQYWQWNWSNHSRVVKKRLNEIRHAKGEDRRRNSYRKLLKVVSAGVKQLRAMTQSHEGTWKTEAEQLLCRVSQVIDQTRRRVLNGQPSACTRQDRQLV